MRADLHRSRFVATGAAQKARGIAQAVTVHESGNLIRVTLFASNSKVEIQDGTPRLCVTQAHGPS